jgi:hypothetical protein
MTLARFAPALALLLAGQPVFTPAKEPVPRPVKLALVPAQHRPAVLGVLELVQAELSSEKRLQLLERRQIEKALKEQAVSLSGLVDASTAVRAGQILGADLFGVLESDDKEAVGLVVYDAATGVTLADVSLPTGEAAARAAAVADAVRAALKKRDLGPDGLKLVGVLSVRNADLPRAKDDLCRSLATVLERELVNSPGVVVLERKRLELLNRERKLTKDAGTERLLGSLFTLELEFSQVRDGPGIRVSAWLRNGKGERLETIRLKGTEPNGGDLTGRLAVAVRQALRVAEQSRAADRRLEARRFAAEAALLWSFQETQSALEHVEAALALDPSLRPARLDHIEWLSTKALQLLGEELRAPRKRTGLVRAVEAEKARAIVEANHRAMAEHFDLIAEFDLKSPRAAYAGAISPLVTRTHHAQVTAGMFVIAADPPSQDWQDRRGGAEQMFVDLLRREALVLARLTGDEPSFALTYSHFLNHQLGYFRGKHPARTALNRLLSTDVTKEWAKVTRQPKVLDYLLRPEALKQYDTWSPRFADLEPAALEVLARHPHPFVAMDALVFLGRAGVSGKNVPTGERLQAFEEAKKVYTGAITTAEKLKDPGQRKTLKNRAYAAWRNGLRQWHLPQPEYTAEMTSLCDFMLDRHDLERDVLLWIRPRPPMWGPTPAEGWRLLGKAVAVADGPRRDEPETPELRTMLLQYRDALLKIEPKLAAADSKLAALPFRDGDEPPWKARLLLRVKDVPSLKTLRFPFQHREKLYCLGVADGAVQLVRIRRDGGGAELLGRCPLTFGRMLNPESHTLTSFCLGDGTVYVGTRQDGIIALPLSGEAGTKLAVELPSPHVTALAFLDDKLIAHAEGGYLLEIDPRTRSVTTLASSRRKDRLTPFDDAEPFRVPFLAADPERSRVVFLCIQPGTRPGTNGLWEYDLKTGRLKRLLEGRPGGNRPSESNLLQFGTAPDGGKILLSSFSATVEFDLATNKAELLRCGGVSPVPSLPPKTARAQGTQSIGVPKLRQGDWLWAMGQPVDRLSLTGRLEHFRSLGPGIPRLWTPEAAYLELLAPDELLVGGGEGFALCVLSAGR